MNRLKIMLQQNNDLNIQKPEKRIDIQSKMEFQIGGRKNRPLSASAVPRNNRPSSASSTRKSSAGGGGQAARIISQQKQNKKNVFDDANNIDLDNSNIKDKDNILYLTRDELIEKLYESKQKLIATDAINSQLKTENERQEIDILRQQKRMDKLLESMLCKKNGHTAEDVRKEIEKTVLVRHLKQQINILRTMVGEKDNEIESLQKNQKNTRLSELKVENNEYLLEIQRQKLIISGLQEKLINFNNTQLNMNETNNSLLNTTRNISDKLNRPQSGHTLNKYKAGNSDEQGKRIPLEVIYNRGESTDILTNFSKTNELNNSNIFINTNEILQQPKPPNIDKKQVPLAASSPKILKGSLLNSATLIMPLKSEPVSLNIDSIYKVGEKVKGMFRNGSTWYNGKK